MMDGGMMNAMGSMMAWMMGVGLLGWVLVIALFVTIVLLLFRLVRRPGLQDRPPGAEAPPAKSRLR